nr:cation:proton antiporter [Hydrococcus sp. Prado102]
GLDFFAQSRELFLLGVVTLCLGIALLTEQLGLSIEMGAFVAGLMISEVEYADQTLTYVEPLRDIFAALFFVSVGMLIDPVFLWNNGELILGLVLLVLVGKVAIITPLVRIFGYSLKTAVIVGLGLAQIGEFSFVLASEGQVLGLVSRRVYLLILGTTAVTLIITPFILRVLPKLFNWLESIPSINHWLLPMEMPQGATENLPQSQHIVVCGYGRTGQNLVGLLTEHQGSVVVIEQSETAIQKLRDGGIPYVYGNAASLHVLAKAGVSQAKSMVIALPDSMSTRLCLKRSLELSPDLDIVVKANHYQDIELLYQLGGSEVVQPELEASLEIGAHLLSKMGLAPSAIAEEIKLIRNSHYVTLRGDINKVEVNDRIENVIVGMNTRWYNLAELCPLVGMTIAHAQIRTLTGATIVAIKRKDGTEINYPNPHTVMEEGDRCLVVGSIIEQIAFEQLMSGEIPLIPTVRIQVGDG